LTPPKMRRPRRGIIDRSLPSGDKKRAGTGRILGPGRQ